MNDRIKLLRKLFDQNGIDGYILPSNDEFLNEYIPASLNRLKWLTGFECSNGLAIITKDKNYFFTDARYSEAARVKFGNSYEIIDIYQNSPWEFIKGLDLIFGVAPELITQRPVIDNLKYISELID